MQSRPMHKLFPAKGPALNTDLVDTTNVVGLVWVTMVLIVVDVIVDELGV